MKAESPRKDEEWLRPPRVTTHGFRRPLVVLGRHSRTTYGLQGTHGAGAGRSFNYRGGAHLFKLIWPKKKRKRNGVDRSLGCRGECSAGRVRLTLDVKFIAGTRLPVDRMGVVVRGKGFELGKRFELGRGKGSNWGRVGLWKRGKNWVGDRSDVAGARRIGFELGDGVGCGKRWGGSNWELGGGQVRCGKGQEKLGTDQKVRIGDGSNVEAGACEGAFIRLWVKVGGQVR